MVLPEYTWVIYKSHILRLRAGFTNLWLQEPVVKFLNHRLYVVCLLCLLIFVTFVLNFKPIVNQYL